MPCDHAADLAEHRSELASLRRDVDRLTLRLDRRDEADRVEALRLVQEARASASDAREELAEATGQHRSLAAQEADKALAAETARKARRIEIAKLVAPFAAAPLGYLLSKLHVVAEWIRALFTSSKGH